MLARQNNILIERRVDDNATDKMDISESNSIHGNLGCDDANKTHNPANAISAMNK